MADDAGSFSATCTGVSVYGDVYQQKYGQTAINMLDTMKYD